MRDLLEAGKLSQNEPPDIPCSMPCFSPLPCVLSLSYHTAPPSARPSGTAADFDSDRSAPAVLQKNRFHVILFNNMNANRRTHTAENLQQRGPCTLKIQESAENYLEAILVLMQKNGQVR